MSKKKKIRNKFLKKRKEKFFEIDKKFFNPLTKIIKHKIQKRVFYISLYYPNAYELNVLRILENKYFKRSKFLLPIIEENYSMNFYQWKKNDILRINKYGIPEPMKSKIIIPDIILVPLLAFDKKKNRLGYGKGFYDRYLNKNLKKKDKKIIAVGVAFSFQKIHKLPINNKDIKLDYIITEKGLM